MQSLFKAWVLFLLAAVIAAPLAAQGLDPESSLDRRPAGCHQPAAPIPQPGPTSHSCCQGGHYPAIMQQGSVARSSLQRLAQLVLPNSIVTVKSSGAPRHPVICGDPPITSPLRV